MFSILSPPLKSAPLIHCVAKSYIVFPPRRTTWRHANQSTKKSRAGNPIQAMSTYEDLPEAAKKYLKRIEELLETPIAMVSVSPQRGRTIQIQDVLSAPEYDARYPRNAWR